MNQYIEKYTYPKLCTRSGDVTKQWYVYFYWLIDGKKQIRVKRGINYEKNKKDRECYGKDLVQAVLNDLKNGWNPITDKVEATPEDVKVYDALISILELKKSYIKPETHRTYTNAINLFNKWLKLKKYDNLFIQNFSYNHAQQYMDYLLRDRKYCGKTYNGYLGNLSSFFSAIEERNKEIKNPFKGIKTLPEDVGANTTYSEEEEKLLSEFLLKDDKHFYLATRFVKYCFFRRTEIAKLQVKHINWRSKTIIVPSKNAKSRRQDSVTIGKTMETIIEESGILNLDPETYIFSNTSRYRTFKFSPGMKKCKRLDDFSDRQRDVNKELGIKSECSFYSWKHTGTCELYNLTTDPYVVMRQCRHSDIKITMRYLRSLGLGVNEQVREW